MIVYNYSVRNVSEEGMDLKYGGSYDYHTDYFYDKWTLIATSWSLLVISKVGMFHNMMDPQKINSILFLDLNLWKIGWVSNV